MTSKTLTETKAPVTEPANETECVHHWIIEPPDGPTSKGVCKICGAVKEFENWNTQDPPQL